MTSDNAMRSARLRYLLLCMNYHCLNDIVQMLASVPLRMRVAIEVVVVDNSRDFDIACVDDICDHFGSLSVLRPDKNLGYLGGAQYGLISSKRPAESYDCVLIVNPDILFEPSFWTALECTLTELSGYGALYPSLIEGPERVERNPFLAKRPSRRYLTLRIAVSSNMVIHSLWLSLWALKRAFMGRRARKARVLGARVTRDIYAGHGSLMIFLPSYFASGADFSYPIFLYGEELYLAEVCRAAGLKSRFDPRLVAHHVGQATTGFVSNRRRRIWNNAALRHIRAAFF